MKPLLIVIILSLLSFIIFKNYFSGNDIITNKNNNCKKTEKDTVYNNDIFTEDVFVKNIDDKELNLKNIEITKDTVMIIVWCKTCGACIKYMDWYKTKNKEKNYQILAIAINKNDTIDKEKEIINKHQWPFQIFFDKNQNLAKFLNKKGFYRNPNYKIRGEGFTSFPYIFMFVKNKFFCISCDKYANPFCN
ncbi:MAG TPA: redoxin domain-containing protein [Bacteroidales bacterium]|nr:redoxin domain-containing protein [Bacteroidales bacterium]HPS17016.1 redoxin domain-containing protein [Bacteroidales bacterium]